jgi:hypothetical protein
LLEPWGRLPKGGRPGITGFCWTGFCGTGVSRIYRVGGCGSGVTFTNDLTVGSGVVNALETGVVSAVGLTAFVGCVSPVVRAVGCVIPSCPGFETYLPIGSDADACFDSEVAAGFIIIPPIVLE